jgi:hypothetical protein
MRHLVALTLVVGCVSTTAFAQGRSGGATAPVTGVCSVLTRELLMKVAPASARAEIQSAKPIDNYVNKELQAAGRAGRPEMGSCSFGPIILAVNALTQPDQARSLLRAQKSPYQRFEPVSGVGDEAYFRDNYFVASLFVFVGSRSFGIEWIAPPGEKAMNIKPNVIALANAVLPQLR